MYSTEVEVESYTKMSESWEGELVQYLDDRTGKTLHCSSFKCLANYIYRRQQMVIWDSQTCNEATEKCIRLANKLMEEVCLVGEKWRLEQHELAMKGSKMAENSM